MAIFTEDFAGTGAMGASWANAGSLERDAGLGKTVGITDTTTVGSSVPFVTTAFGASQYAQFTVQSASWSDYASGPGVKFADAYIDEYYCCSFDESRIFILKSVGGAKLNIKDSQVTGVSVSIGVGTVVKITAEPAGADLVIKAFVDGVEKLSVTDTSPLTGSNICIAGYYYSPDIRFDNFEGGDLAAPGASATLNATLDPAVFSGSASVGSIASLSINTAAAVFSGTASVSNDGLLTLPALKNNTGTLLASETGATAHVYATSGAHVVTKTGQTTNSSGVMTITDPLIVASTQYRVVVVLASGAEGMDKVTAA